MEQRRVLLIIVSITIVLAAIVGVGIWQFYPRADAEPDSIAEAGGGLEWEPLDYLRGTDELPGLEDDAGMATDDEGDFVVTYGVAEDSDEPDGVSDPGTPFVTEAGDAASSAGVTTTPSQASRESREADRRATGAPTDAATTEVNTTDATTTARADDTVARSPAPSTATQPSTAAANPSADRARTELADRAYWVQVISSPNRDTVEVAQRTLREYQLGSRILTKEIGGTVYFRLRLGPFAVREEAEKFLGWVTDIDGFADSMIFVDYTTVVLAAQPQ